MDFPQVTANRRRFLESAASSYASSLWGSPGATYLMEKRGLTEEVIKHFRLGFVSEPREGHEQYTGTVSIPYLTPAGVVGIRFRSLGEGTKYLQEAGSRTPLFNVRAFHAPETHIAICEGEFDAIVLSGLCNIPAVGIPGVSHWEKNENIWRRLFEDYERVFVVMDPDKAGQNMAKKIMSVVQDPTSIVLPDDVNDTYLTFGPEFIRAKCGLD